jgi:phage terminase small subunit
VRSPAFQVARDASAQARQWARELGLTTDSHARIGLTDPRSPDSREDLLSSPFA